VGVDVLACCFGDYVLSKGNENDGVRGREDLDRLGWDNFPLVLVKFVEVETQLFEEFRRGGYWEGAHIARFMFNALRIKWLLD
jgi:hypothetical protein